MDNDKVRQDPYQGLAPIYDYVMRHVDYGEWVDYVHSLLERWDPDATQVCDLACGTGKTLTALWLHERMPSTRTCSWMTGSPARNSNAGRVCRAYFSC